MKSDRILLSALIFSVVWHLFWMSALTVVVAPKDAKPPKFSNISFLGPILGASILEVSSATHERSTFEKRYISDIENLSVPVKAGDDFDVYAGAGLDAGANIFEHDETLESLAIPAIDGNKIDPGNSQ